MASIYKEFVVHRPVDAVWNALRDISAVHRRLAAGFVTDTKLDGDCRIVTFANGVVARERIITVDDVARRVVYSVLGPEIVHHQGVMHLVPESADVTRMIWTADFLPDAWRTSLEPMMDTGAEVMRQTLSRA